MTVSSTIIHSLEQTRPEPPQPWVLMAKGGCLVPTSRNKHPKPPTASRRQAVLFLRKEVLLFHMQANMAVGAHDIIMSSRNARPTMMVATISTSCVSRVENSSYYNLLVSFYPRRQVNDKNPSKFLNYKLVMPKDWTPRMYLGL